MKQENVSLFVRMENGSLTYRLDATGLNLLRCAIELDDRVIDLVFGGRAFQCPLIALSLSSLRCADLVSRNGTVDRIIIDTDKFGIEDIIDIIMYVTGGIVTITGKRLRTFFAAARYFSIPSLVESLQRPIRLRSVMNSIVQKIMTYNLSPNEIPDVAPFLCFAASASTCIARMDDYTLISIGRNSKFRAPSEDVVLDLFIERPAVLSEILCVPMLSPTSRRIFIDKYTGSRSPYVRRLLEMIQSPALPESERLAAMENNPRYTTMSQILAVGLDAEEEGEVEDEGQTSMAVYSRNEYMCV